MPHETDPSQRGDIIVQFEWVEPPKPQEPESPPSKRKNPPVEYPLLVTLEEVLTGVIKKVPIIRSITDDNYNVTSETVELTVDIKPGVTPGTNIAFPEEGDRHPDTIPADIIFVIADEPHPIFKRHNMVNLSYTAKISFKVCLKLNLKTIFKLWNCLKFKLNVGFNHANIPFEASSTW